MSTVQHIDHDKISVNTTIQYLENALSVYCAKKYTYVGLRTIGNKNTYNFSSHNLN